MISYKFLRTQADRDTVAVVTLERPPVNAVDREMYIELAELFRNPDAIADDLRAIVLTGSGKHFCATIWMSSPP
jgi:enoyl-CoA hydratase